MHQHVHAIIDLVKNKQTLDKEKYEKVSDAEKKCAKALVTSLEWLLEGTEESRDKFVEEVRDMFTEPANVFAAVINSYVWSLQRKAANDSKFKLEADRAGWLLLLPPLFETLLNDDKRDGDWHIRLADDRDILEDVSDNETCFCVRKSGQLGLGDTGQRFWVSMDDNEELVQKIEVMVKEGEIECADEAERLRDEAVSNDDDLSNVASDDNPTEMRCIKVVGSKGSGKSLTVYTSCLRFCIKYRRPLAWFHIKKDEPHKCKVMFYIPSGSDEQGNNCVLMDSFPIRDFDHLFRRVSDRTVIVFDGVNEDMGKVSSTFYQQVITVAKGKGKNVVLVHSGSMIGESSAEARKASFVKLHNVGWVKEKYESLLKQSAIKTRFIQNSLDMCKLVIEREVNYALDLDKKEAYQCTFNGKELTQIFQDSQDMFQRLVAAKHFVSGLNARFFFDFGLSKIVTEYFDALWRNINADTIRGVIVNPNKPRVGGEVNLTRVYVSGLATDMAMLHEIASHGTTSTLIDRAHEAYGWGCMVGDNTCKGVAFEHWFHAVMNEARMEHKIVTILHSQFTDHTQRKLAVNGWFKYSSIEEFGRLFEENFRSNHLYFVPTQSNNPGFDAIHIDTTTPVVTFLQMTVASDHSVLLTKALLILQKIKALWNANFSIQFIFLTDRSNHTVRVKGDIIPNFPSYYTNYGTTKRWGSTKAKENISNHYIMCVNAIALKNNQTVFRSQGADRDDEKSQK